MRIFAELTGREIWLRANPDSVWLTSIGDRNVGIHFPCFGYVAARGQSTVREDRDNGYNSKKIEAIEAYFAFIRPRLYYFESWFVGNAAPSPVECFPETLFETDLDLRPELRKFIDYPAEKKSLVVPTFKDLFDGPNAFVDDFGRRSIDNFIPIIEIENENVPMTPSWMKREGKMLPNYIMSNQYKVRMKIEDRLKAMETIEKKKSSVRIRLL